MTAGERELQQSTNRLTGECLCGAVRYTSAQPLLTLICHCLNCQKQSGSAFSVNAIVPSGDVSIEGALKAFEDRGNTGAIVERLFCPSCGSPVLTKVATHPELIIIKAGTAESGRHLTPVAEMFCDRSFDWIGELAAKRFALGATSAELFG